MAFTLMDELCESTFWDTNITWNTDKPDFTVCFKNTVLIWIPCFYLWIFFPLECYFVRKSNNGAIPLNKYNVTKLIFIFLMILQIFIESINDEIIESFSKPAIYVHTSAMKFLTSVLFFILTWANIRMGVRSSGILFIYSLILVICNLPQIRTLATFQLNTPAEIIQFIYTSFGIIPSVVIFVLNCFADAKPKYGLCKEFDNDPANEASFLSKLFLFWFDSFVWENYRKPIENILFNISPEEKVTYLSSKFEKYYKPSNESKQKDEKSHELEELGSYKKNVSSKAKYSFIKPIFLIIWFDLFKCVIWKLIEMLSVLAYPLIFSLFLTFMLHKEHAWKGYLCSLLFLLNGLLQAITLNEVFVIIMKAEFKVKGTLTSAIYKKALRISNGARQKYTTGDITNLLSVDTQRVAGSLRPTMISWTSPIQMALTCYFIWNILGPSVLASFIVMMALLPLINYLVRKMKQLQIVEMKNKDKRGKFIQELLAGIKILKLYAWEAYFQKEVFRLRKKEMKIIRRHSFLSALLLFVFACTPFLMSAATFATYVLSSTQHSLNVKIAFVTISFFNALRNPFQILPELISSLTQASVSIKRINEFLNLEELDPNDISHDDTVEALIIENGCFSWNNDGSTPTLYDLNIRIPEGSIVSIVGPVGAGKSSLISAFLGEMYKLKGYVNTKGEIAYVSQQAWILNTTLKENITLGKPFNESLYDKVLEACALKPDLATMSDYDMTEIGEKGINLSGGQKQRISLARALYHEADVYLLDDPLSAVNFHVANHIFQNALGPCGMLKNKTRLLVTHAIPFLPQTDFIIMMQNGRTLEIDTYDSLLQKNANVTEFLHTYAKDVNENIDNAKECETEKPNELNDTSSLKHRVQRDNSEHQNKKRLIEKEHVESGKIDVRVYSFYLSAIGKLLACVALMMFILYQTFSVTSNVWLLMWSTASTSVDDAQSTSNKYFYFEVYLGLGIIEALAVLIGNLTLFTGLLKASSYFHDTLLTNILRWPSWLLDSTPIGRVINRLTADVFTLDSVIGTKIAYFINFLGRLLSICFVIIYTTPVCAIVVIPILIFLYIIQKFYASLVHQLNRIEAINKSPLYSYFVETISGLSSVRAYKYQDQSYTRACEKIDRCSSSFLASYICLRCLATKMDILGGCIAFFASYFIVSERNNLDIGLIGFTMSYSIQMTRELTWLLLRGLEIKNGIVAVERIKDFIEQPQEAPSYLSSDIELNQWPEKGEIIFENYSLRYREDMDLVLNKISAKIKSGEKIGIVGRTGAGKTSLILGLFRLIEPSDGKILIDNVDISTIGLHLLRSRLTLIPQDPVLFLGTLRFNLDPTEKYSDENLWQILEKAHLKNFVQELTGGLYHDINEGGGNISYGQKQLICLARALLRKTKVLILDEATASVDFETDELVQKTIRNEFSDCTVLTIAHRINTVQDYDRILVIDDGAVVEFDTPSNLIESKKSVFYNMARGSGLIST